ncbi:MAG: hypothetical protein V3U59_04195 [Gammaproteobacteria bacterium]
MNRTVMLAGSFTKIRKVNTIIRVAKKRSLTVYAALDNVLREIRKVRSL